MRKDGRQTPAPVSSKPEIENFIDQVRALGPSTARGGRGRLIFALDATMSRQPTWDTACTLQAEMFREAAGVGGLDIQLVYFRGLHECRASGWVAGSDDLAELMSRIDCRGGQTQIGKVLSHARQEYGRRKVQAMVFVGDAMEEPIDSLCQAAVNWDCLAFLSLCSRKAMTLWPRMPIVKLRGYRAELTAGSMPALPNSSVSYCEQSLLMPQAASRHLPS
jgi:hypothetical protein